MKALLIHQNFPGQFRQLVPHLISQGYELRALCSHQRPLDLPFEVMRYQVNKDSFSHENFIGLSFWSEALTRAPLIWQHCQLWKKKGWNPDVILGHAGWGETLLLHELWPCVPQVLWPEMWVQPIHAGIGFETGLDEPSLHQRIEFESRNQLTRAALSHANAWVLPTRYQADSFPADLCDKRMHVIHEGINTTIACPDPQASYVVRGIHIDANTPTITFVNRNLERLRGFHQFMRALPSIQRFHPNVRTMIVGDNGVGYGGLEECGRGLREVMIDEIGSQIDFERVHFLGRISYPALLTLLQASWVHVYLTYPYILGWSLLEAMACGCCIVGSNGMPIEEVIKNGSNGILIPFNQPQELAAKVCSLLANSSMRRMLGEQARVDSLAWDQSVMTPRFDLLLSTLVA